MTPSPTDYFALFDCVGATLFVLDPATLDVRFFGEGAQSLLGRAPDTHCAGDSFWKALIPPDELDAVINMLRSVGPGCASSTLEHRARVDDRGEVWLRTSVRHSDASDSVVGVIQDVTASRHNERQWREVERWLVTLGETLPFDFWICDREGRYVLQNPVSLKRLGHALGRRTAELDLPEEAKRSWQQTFNRALGGEAVHEELESDFEGGRRFFARVLAPVGQGDDINGVLGVDIDITQLKQSEERLRRSLEELSQAQQTLVQREQLAALGEMAALIAHEVRNPLGSIANAVALLHKSEQTPQSNSLLWRIIEDEVERLDLLVCNLLDFVRPSRPKFSPRSLESVVESALVLTLRTEGAAERIRVIRIIEPALPPVLMDGQLLELAFTNVFRNAVQAMAAGGELHVNIGQEERENAQWARVSIRDSGSGIGPEVQSRIFRPFVTTRATGHGLGLTIVKKVLDQHRGEVDFHSHLGQGTTCVMRIPMVG